MRGFGDFKRVAIVLLPDDDELKSRIEKKIEADGKESTKDLTEFSLNEMKGKTMFCFSDVKHSNKHITHLPVNGVLCDCLNG